MELDPGETVVAEAGAMAYLEDGITFEAKMGDGSAMQERVLGSLLSAGKRAVSGEFIFMTHFTNEAAGKARAAFASPYPGQILPVNLEQHYGSLLCQKDAFLCAGARKGFGSKWLEAALLVGRGAGSTPFSRLA